MNSSILLVSPDPSVVHEVEAIARFIDYDLHVASGPEQTLLTLPLVDRGQVIDGARQHVVDLGLTRPAARTRLALDSWVLRTGRGTRFLYCLSRGADMPVSEASLELLRSQAQRLEELRGFL